MQLLKKSYFNKNEHAVKPEGDHPVGRPVQRIRDRGAQARPGNIQSHRVQIRHHRLALAGTGFFEPGPVD